MVGPRVTGCFSTLGLENQQGSHLGGIFPTVQELVLATGIPKSRNRNLYVA